MSSQPILRVLNSFDKYKQICRTLNDGGGALSVFGLGEAHKTHISAGLFFDLSKTILYVLPTDADCIKVEAQLSAYAVNVLHFPAKNQPLDTIAYAAFGGTANKRIETLIHLKSGVHTVILTCAEALMQKLAPKELLYTSIFRIKQGDTLDLTSLIRALINAGYQREEICQARGQFTVRGGRLDVFATNAELPYRIEFFGDEVDTMREFDPNTQRSTDNVGECVIFPATETPTTLEMRQKAASKLINTNENEELIRDLQDDTCVIDISQLLPLLYDKSVSLIDYLPEESVIIIDEPARFIESAETEFSLFASNVEAALATNPTHDFLWKLLGTPQETVQLLNTDRTLMYFIFTQTFSAIRPHSVIKFDAQNAPTFHNDDAILVSDMKNYIKANATVVIFAGEHAQQIQGMLSKNDVLVGFRERLDRDIVIGERLIVAQSMQQGFEYREYKFVCLSEIELFGQGFREHVVHPEKKRKSTDKLMLSSLNVGDFIVHEVHGIGRFAGVESLSADGKMRDYILLLFQKSAKLYIPTDQLDRVSKYIGNDDVIPALSRLGSGEWQRTVSRVRSGVKQLAIDLVRLYGERMNKTGYAFPHDTVWQKEFESAFPYDETPDQLTCIEEIKADMESPKIMDRLLCGDVGFGKTEVAVRMAFKAAMDGKQVAFLVPTTILAHQHYNTLATRLSQYPIRVDYISRFKTKQEQHQTLTKLARGEIDIIIGTHRLLSKDVKFSDLGLLIIDEEQRFGVGHKEQIKDIKKSVDVLTLTATPIPRTLHMSMVGIRDISLIDTPPSQRYPVATYITEYSELLIREAILKEIGRGGQVFFLYNSVKNMQNFYEKLCAILPQVKVRYAHGQMPEHQLEEVMLEFLEGAFDVLLCSTIIENGLDITNANTIIIYDADKFGLSQLYQLRGRVGRGTRLGYAYLTFQRNKVFTEESQKRLLAIREFTQLGSGHRIAMRDMQIRGAGNLLGAEQHGRIAEVGYDMYRKLMSEAINEAKGMPVEKPKTQTLIEVAVDAYIPRDYISNEEWRLTIYKRIASITNYDDVLDVQDELIDRFGDIPLSVENLINVAYLKSTASDCFITNVQIMDGEATLAFESGAPYDFNKLIMLAQQEKARFVNDDKTKVILQRKGTSVQQLCTMIPQFLCKLYDCIDLEN